MKTPAISIIMPVFNGEEHLRDTIGSIQAQTFGDFEVICVDGGSADHCVDMIREAMERDDRFHLLQQENAGAGAARNYGFAAAQGEYAIFLNQDDLCAPRLLEQLYTAASSQNADIAACNFSRLHRNGRITQHAGVQTQWLPAGAAAFSYRDCPDYVMRVIDSAPGNKLCRSSFLRERGLKFDELVSSNELAFSAVSAASAEQIAVVADALVQYRAESPEDTDPVQRLNDITAAVFSAVGQVSKLPHSEMLHSAMLSFVVGNFITAMMTCIKDFGAPEAETFYRMVHELFNREEFARVDARTLRNPKQYREFCTVRKHGYDAMKELTGRRLILSLTTYPRRIGTLGTVLETVYAQTRKADEVVLWLAEEQFPGKEADLPADLRKLVSENRLTVRWCEDLKPHKKYFYALQAYQDDLVVTVDDDLLYPKDMLDALYRSYLLYPDAVSTLRAHLVMVSERNEIMCYNTWIQETDSCIYQPSMQLMATGGAGVLYPPHLLKKEYFDAEAIRENCLWADDLWLKMMQLMSDVPVVVARPFEPLHYLPGSQEEALHQLNVRQNHNDVQLANISKWLDETCEPGILVRKLTASDIGVKILGMEAVSRHLDEERRAIRRNWNQADSKIKSSDDRAKQAESRQQQAELKQRQAENKLRQTQERLHQTETALRGTENRLRQTEQKLTRAQQEKARLEPLASVGGQYRDLGDFLKQLKADNGMSLSWCLKYFLYLLAWVPAKLLIATTYLLKNGGGAAWKRLIRKISRRR